MSEKSQHPKPDTDQEWTTKLERYAANGRVSAVADGCEQEATIAQLPLWPEPQRVAPNAILRSALFGVVRRGKRRFVEGETLLVSAWSGSSIRFMGQQLGQYDLDVWLQALHIARQQDLGDANGIRFTARSFLKAMGRKYSGDAAHVLFRSFERMVACAVTIRVGKVRYMGSLVESLVQHEPTQLYVLRLNPKLRALFGTGNTRMDWATRLALPTDLSRWMHGYVLSHRATKASPHRIGVATLRDLSGSTAAALWKFREHLRRAMTLLAEVRAVTIWRITKGDALEFVRPGAPQKELAGGK